MGQSIPFANREAYYSLFEKFLGKLKRDIFSGDLVYFDEQSKTWQPVVNKIKYLRSEFQAYMEKNMFDEGLRYSLSKIEDHIAALEHSMEPQIPIKLPIWDKQDRIEELACRIELKPVMRDFGIDNTILYKHLKLWHAQMWARVFNPSQQNQIFILAGPQEAGKDFWIEQNIGGLGQYRLPFSIDRNERDVKAQLHQGLVMNISEFDRAAKMEIALLKEIVTAESTNLRFSYDRRHQYRLSRCSFIASCNTSEILVDYTGNRRFVIFEVDYVKRGFEFSEEDKLQILRQGFDLFRSGFRLRDDEWIPMKKYINARTPVDPTDEAIEIFEIFATKRFYQLNDVEQDRGKDLAENQGFDVFLPNEHLLNVIQEVSKHTDFKPRRIRNILKNKGMNKTCRKNNTTQRGYCFNLKEKSLRPDHNKFFKQDSMFN